MLGCCLKNIGLKGAQTIPSVPISLGPAWDKGELQVSEVCEKDI